MCGMENRQIGRGREDILGHCSYCMVTGGIESTLYLIGLFYYLTF